MARVHRTCQQQDQQQENHKTNQMRQPADTGANRKRVGAIYVLASLALILAAVAITPTESASFNALSRYRSPRDRGCYYMLQHFNNGDQIKTDEPCLNCTCENSMLMCYLRVCPYVKPVGDRCVIERVKGECCPKIICSDVGPPQTEQEPEPETVAPTTTASSSSPLPPVTSAAPFDVAIANASEVHSGEGGCVLNDVYYHEGAQMPSDPSKPCEVCYCIKNSSACVMQDCALDVTGCSPIYAPGGCCPTRYNCSAAAFGPNKPKTPLKTDTSSRRRFWEFFNGASWTTTTTTEMPLMFASSSSSSPRPSLFGEAINATTTARPMAFPEFGRGAASGSGSAATGCRLHGSSRTFADGERVPSKNKCEHCYCMRNEIVCAVQECRPPCDGCTAILDPEDQSCCPKRYECAAPTQRVSTDNIVESLELATVSSNLTSPEAATTEAPATSVSRSFSSDPIDKLPETTPPLETTYSTTSPPVTSSTGGVDDSNKFTISEKPTDTSSNLAGIDVASDTKPEVSLMTTRQTKPPMRPISPKISLNDEDSLNEMSPVSSTGDSTKPIPNVASSPATSENVDGFNLNGEREQENDPNKTQTNKVVVPEGSQLVGPNQSTDSNEIVSSLTSTVAPPKLVQDGSVQPPLSTSITVDDTTDLAADPKSTVELPIPSVVTNETRPAVVPSSIPGEGSCRYNNKIYQNGEEVKSKDGCMEICMCINSVVYCDEVDCPAAPANPERCKKYQVEGECCPRYECQEVSVSSETSSTTEAPSSTISPEPQTSGKPDETEKANTIEAVPETTPAMIEPVKINIETNSQTEAPSSVALSTSSASLLGESTPATSIPSEMRISEDTLPPATETTANSRQETSSVESSFQAPPEVISTSGSIEIAPTTEAPSLPSQDLTSAQPAVEVPSSSSTTPPTVIMTTLSSIPDEEQLNKVSTDAPKASLESTSEPVSTIIGDSQPEAASSQSPQEATTTTASMLSSEISNNPDSITVATDTNKTASESSPGTTELKSTSIPTEGTSTQTAQDLSSTKIESSMSIGTGSEESNKVNVDPQVETSQNKSFGSSSDTPAESATVQPQQEVSTTLRPMQLSESSTSSLPAEATPVEFKSTPEVEKEPSSTVPPVIESSAATVPEIAETSSSAPEVIASSQPETVVVSETSSTQTPIDTSSSTPNPPPSAGEQIDTLPTSPTVQAQPEVAAPAATVIPSFQPETVVVAETSSTQPPIDASSSTSVSLQTGEQIDTLPVSPAVQAQPEVAPTSTVIPSSQPETVVVFETSSTHTPIDTSSSTSDPPPSARDQIDNLSVSPAVQAQPEVAETPASTVIPSSRPETVVVFETSSTHTPIDTSSSTPNPPPSAGEQIDNTALPVSPTVQAQPEVAAPAATVIPSFQPETVVVAETSSTQPPIETSSSTSISPQTGEQIDTLPPSPAVQAQPKVEAPASTDTPLVSTPDQPVLVENTPNSIPNASVNEIASTETTPPPPELIKSPTEIPTVSTPEEPTSSSTSPPVLFSETNVIPEDVSSSTVKPTDLSPARNLESVEVVSMGPPEAMDAKKDEAPNRPELESDSSPAKGPSETSMTTSPILISESSTPGTPEVANKTLSPADMFAAGSPQPEQEPSSTPPPPVSETSQFVGKADTMESVPETTPSMIEPNKISETSNIQTGEPLANNPSTLSPTEQGEATSASSVPSEVKINEEMIPPATQTTVKSQQETAPVESSSQPPQPEVISSNGSFENAPSTEGPSTVPQDTTTAQPAVEVESSSSTTSPTVIDTTLSSITVVEPEQSNKISTEIPVEPQGSTTQGAIQPNDTSSETSSTQTQQEPTSTPTPISSSEISIDADSFKATSVATNTNNISSDTNMETSMAKSSSRTDESSEAIPSQPTQEVTSSPIESSTMQSISAPAPSVSSGNESEESNKVYVDPQVETSQNKSFGSSSDTPAESATVQPQQEVSTTLRPMQLSESSTSSLPAEATPVEFKSTPEVEKEPSSTVPPVIESSAATVPEIAETSSSAPEVIASSQPETVVVSETSSTQTPIDTSSSTPNPPPSAGEQIDTLPTSPTVQAQPEVAAPAATVIPSFQPETVVVAETSSTQPPIDASSSTSISPQTVEQIDNLNISPAAHAQPDVSAPAPTVIPSSQPENVVASETYSTQTPIEPSSSTSIQPPSAGNQTDNLPVSPSVQAQPEVEAPGSTDTPNASVNEIASTETTPAPELNKSPTEITTVSTPEEPTSSATPPQAPSSEPSASPAEVSSSTMNPTESSPARNVESVEVVTMAPPEIMDVKKDEAPNRGELESDSSPAKGPSETSMTTTPVPISESSSSGELLTTMLPPEMANITLSPADMFAASISSNSSSNFKPVDLTTIIPSIRGSSAPITIPWSDIITTQASPSESIPETTTTSTTTTTTTTTTRPSSTTIVPSAAASFGPSDSPVAPANNSTESDYEEVTEDSGCEYEGKTYNSAQQIPRSHPCDFCFCFRGDIICLQQTCPPPVPQCFETIIDGFCCPRYECPVHTVRTSPNSTSLSLMPFDTHSRLQFNSSDSLEKQRANSNIKGCFVENKLYGVGQVIESASNPCLDCRCTKNGMMRCLPKECTPEDPLLQQINREVIQSTLSRSQSVR